MPRQANHDKKHSVSLSLLRRSAATQTTAGLFPLPIQEMALPRSKSASGTNLQLEICERVFAHAYRSVPPLLLDQLHGQFSNRPRVRVVLRCTPSGNLNAAIANGAH